MFLIKFNCDKYIEHKIYHLIIFKCFLVVSFVCVEHLSETEEHVDLSLWKQC